jgi:hypothetical protein
MLAGRFRGNVLHPACSTPFSRRATRANAHEAFTSRPTTGPGVELARKSLLGPFSTPTRCKCISAEMHRLLLSSVSSLEQRAPTAHERRARILTKARGLAWRRKADRSWKILPFQDAAARRIAARLRSTSSSVVAHDDTLMRIAV